VGPGRDGNKQATQLVKKLEVKPQTSDASRSLEQGGDENLAALDSRELRAAIMTGMAVLIAAAAWIATNVWSG
jgi:hypothetical protein